MPDMFLIEPIARTHYITLTLRKFLVRCVNKKAHEPAPVFKTHKTLLALTNPPVIPQPSHQSLTNSYLCLH